MSAVIKKELKSYYNSTMGYIITIVFLGLSSWLFFKTFFLYGEASMRSYFNMMPVIFMLFIPAITMRQWAEERKLGTIEVLFTLPLKDTEILLGKFFASFVFLVIMLVLTITIPISISFIGKPDFGEILTGYIGSLLLGAAYLSIGLFASSLTSSQIVAFILGLLFSFALFIVGESFVTMTLPPAIAPIVRYFGLGYHFDSIARGVIDMRDLIYYLSVIVIFLYLTYIVIKERR